MDIPYMIVAEDMIEEINSLFLDLTGYDEKNILGKKVKEVWRQLLRISIDSEELKHSNEADCYMFDRSRNVKEISIIYSEMVISEKCIYTFQQKKNTMFEEKFPFLEMVNRGNGIGVSLYSIPNLILLKVNDSYFQHYRKIFKSKEDILGLSLVDLIPGANKEEIKEAYMNMARSDQPLSFKEQPVEFPGIGKRYIDFTLTPVFEEGDLRYIIQTHHDVTEMVMYRQALSDKNRIIEEQKNQLETILETVSKSIALLIIDKKGNFFGDRNMINNYFLPFGYKENIMETYAPGIYFDENGKELLTEELPISRGLKGETVTKSRLTMKMQDGVKHFLMNATPIFDRNGSITMTVACGWDITDRIKHQNYLESQRDYLFRLFNSLQFPILALSYPDFKVKSINTRAISELKELFGFTDSIDESNIIGKSFIDAVASAEKCDESLFFERLRESRSTVIHENMEAENNGRKVYFNIIYQPIVNIEGEIEEILVVGIDITSEVEKRNQMEEIIKMKDEFLYLISHEFKTPLTVINAAVQTIEYIYAGQMPEKAGLMIEKVKQNVNRQLRLVDNMLDITRINAGQIKLRKRNVDIVHLAKAITESVAFYAQQKGVEMVFVSKLRQRVIGVDDEKFERIMLNLLSNAIKFTPKGKKVVVELGAKLYGNRRMICIKVKDQGAGIPKEKQSQIFKRFGQVDSSLTRPAEGSGIGLHLVKLMADAFGGDITLESESGKGSIFTLVIPSKKARSSEADRERQEVFGKRIIQSMATELSDIYF